MSKEETEMPIMDDDIDVSTEESPIWTAYEPEFRRVFARGTLLQVDEDYPDTLQVGFWSTKDLDVEFEEDGETKTGTGYRLETEVMMTWETALRMQKLLNNYIEEHAPEKYLE